MKNNKRSRRLETDLYEPVENYFIEQGYVVHGEVNDCDVVAVKDDALVIIELKTSLTVDLLMQASKRQRLTEQVYVAIPKPTYSLHSKKWKDLLYLIRRLELGLFIVTFKEDDAQITVILQPDPFDRVKSMAQSKKRRIKLLKEIQGRSANYNIGGSTQTKIMTAYKENCIHIACCLEHYGSLSPKDLRELGTGEATQTILGKNHYGWFEKVERGIYRINEKGLSEHKENLEIANIYTKLIAQNSSKQ